MNEARLHFSPPIYSATRLLFQTQFYLLLPWSRASCVAYSAYFWCSRLLVPGAAYRLHPCLSHPCSCAGADAPDLTGRSSSSRFDVVSTTDVRGRRERSSSPSSGPSTSSDRRLDALATKGGEKCRLKPAAPAMRGKLRQRILPMAKNKTAPDESGAAVFNLIKLNY